MKEADARALGEHVNALDAFRHLRKELVKNGRRLRIHAESEDECLYGDVLLTQGDGIVILDNLIRECESSIMYYEATG